MFGKNNIENLKLLKNASVGMLMIERENKSEPERSGFEIILYAKNKDNNLVCIGSAAFYPEVSDGEYRIPDSKLNNEKLFMVGGYTGAYPGFGHVLYTLSMMEIQDRGGKLVPDQRGLSDDAEKLYKNMVKMPNIITSDHLKDALNSYPCPFLSSTFELVVDDGMLAMRKFLEKNHHNNNLSKSDIFELTEQAYDLGECMLPENNEIDRKKLMSDFKKGYPQFNSIKYDNDLSI